MKGLNFEDKIKLAALTTTLKHQLKDIGNSTERTARNLIEFAQGISHDKFSSEQIEKLQLELTSILKPENFAEIKDWIITKFHLN